MTGCVHGVRYSLRGSSSSDTRLACLDRINGFLQSLGCLSSSFSADIPILSTVVFLMVQRLLSRHIWDSCEELCHFKFDYIIFHHVCQHYRCASLFGFVLIETTCRDMTYTMC